MAETNEPKAARPSAWRLAVPLGILVLVAVLGAVFMHLRQRHRLAHEADERAHAAQQGPRVSVARVEVTAGARDVTLPGDVRAFNQVQLTARVSGYLRRIDVDVGAHVKKDQVLGILEAPQIEEQVRAARADLLVKTRNAARARKLAPPGIISQAELEQAVGDLQVSRANLKAAEAQRGYATLRAPFDGVVTGRFADPGALLQPGTPLVELRDPDRLRVTVYVGQEAASFLKPGDAAEIVQDEHPDRPIRAQVSRVASALDERSRTMLTEIWLDNRQARLVPGVFVHVTLHVQAPPLPTVPAEALFTRGAQNLVAVVENGTVRLRQVEPGINDGKTIQVKRGLRSGETVALNLPGELGEGSHVQAVQRPRPAPEGGAQKEPPRSARTPPPGR